MKKNLALVLVFAFILALAINLPAKAEDTATTTATTTVITTTATSTVATTTATTTKFEDRGNIDTSKYEKIPSPDYIRYFKQIIKKDGVLFGIRIEHNATATAAIQKVEERKASTTLEKIASPDQIKFFEKITKIGNALFGVKKNDAKLTSSASTSLEKIATPEQIKFFERITKIGNALFGIRKADAPKKLPEMSSTTIACVSTAIDDKDKSLSVIFAASSADVLSLIEQRGACQKEALNSTTRQESLNACNKAFTENIKKINETVKERQKKAWTVYTNALKECSAKNTDSGIIMIEDGGQKMSETLEQ